jgi:exosortase F-associated protein
MLKPKSLPVRVLLVIVACSLLATTYILQQANVAGWLGVVTQGNEKLIFVLNKTARLVINDFACILLIHSFFQERKYTRLAFYVFLIELLILLPCYFAIKLTLEGPTEISSPILSQIHRLIVNPMLMVVLIASFYYQKKFAPARG